MCVCVCVCVCVCTWRGGVIAGPNAFIASMKRPETLMKTKKHTKKATDRGSSLSVPPLCAAAPLSVNF